MMQIAMAYCTELSPKGNPASPTWPAYLISTGKIKSSTSTKKMLTVRITLLSASISPISLNCFVKMPLGVPVLRYFRGFRP